MLNEFSRYYGDIINIKLTVITWMDPVRQLCIRDCKCIGSDRCNSLKITLNSMYSNLFPNSLRSCLPFRQGRSHFAVQRSPLSAKVQPVLQAQVSGATHSPSTQPLQFEQYYYYFSSLRWAQLNISPEINCTYLAQMAKHLPLWNSNPLLHLHTFGETHSPFKQPSEHFGTQVLASFNS